jgi:DNA-binding MarR family transcriptional regulator
MEDKVELTEKIQAVDENLRELWDAMDEANQKLLKSELYILNRFISNAEGQPRHIQEHFVLTVNEYFNKHWFDLQKHPKLLWLLLCMCSHDSKKRFFHKWIGHKKRKSENKKIRFIEELYPDKNSQEIDLLCSKYTNKELYQIAKELGMDDSAIDKALK